MGPSISDPAPRRYDQSKGLAASLTLVLEAQIDQLKEVAGAAWPLTSGGGV
jgi:hypothetical protein